MPHLHDAWAEHQRRRFMRPDAHRYIRPDAYRFMPPGAPRLLGKEAVRYFWPEYQTDEAPQAADREYAAALRAEREHLLKLQSELAALKAEIKFQRLRRALKAYNPDQPRVPAGNPDGGQWTSDGGQGDRIRIAQLGGTVTDADGRPYYRPGGHHEMPEGVHKKWKLRPETQKVFRQSSTGTLGATLRIIPDAVRQGNVWDGDGGLHLAYNQAVEELSNRFLRDHNLRPDASDMIPNHAHALLKLIRESEDPRIRDFNANMRRIQRLRRFRGGADD